MGRPIIFSAPMVRALLDGRKTQTRRVLKPQPYVNGFHFDGRDILCHEDFLPPAALLMDRGKGKGGYRISDMEDGLKAFTKYEVGDRLWVRESVCAEEDGDHGRLGVRYLADDQWLGGCGASAAGVEGWFILRTYRSTDPDLDGGKPVPSIHMPRWASRLTLTVTDVRVERLNNISEVDAQAEGAMHVLGDCRYSPHKEGFHDVWRAIHGADAWDANPWIVALTFTVGRHNIDAVLT
jgi:hypothetical protein